MSQLNFFMLEKEATEALQWIYSTEEFKLFEGRFFSSKNPVAITSIDQIRGSMDYTIWVQNNYTDAVCSSTGGGDYLGKFLFDNYFDPIIDFSSCTTDKKILSPGRLYYKAGWIKNLEVRSLHKKQCERIVRYFKRNLVNLSSPFKMTGSIQKLILSGYTLELGKGGRKITAAEMSGT